MKNTMKPILAGLVLCLSSSLSCAADLEAMRATGKGENSDLSNTSLIGAKLADIKMDGSKFMNSDLTDASINDCGECNFTGARLIRTNFEKASIDEVILNNTQIVDAIFTKAYAHNPRVRNAVISGAKMDRVNMSKGKFEKASIKNTSMIGAQLKMSTFADAVLNNVDLSYADLTYADFTGAKLQGTKFAHAVLYAVEFINADLSGADFRGADITGAYFKRAYGFDTSKQQYGDIPSSVSCDELKARGAVVDTTTKCNL